MKRISEYVDNVDTLIQNISDALKSEWDDSVSESLWGFIEDLNKSKSSLEVSANNIDGIIEEVTKIDVNKIREKVEQVCGDNNV